MKNIIGLVLMALTVAGLWSQPARAAVVSEALFVGTVTYQGQPVEGVQVYVNCPGAGVYAEKPTDAQGHYEVRLSSDQCPSGDDVKVWVLSAKLHLSGWTFGKITGAITRVNVDLKNLAPQVPEYGWLGGVLAAGVGVGMVVYNRRRYVQE